MNVRSGLRWTKVRPIWDFINIFHFTNSIFYQLEKVIVLCTYSSILLAHMCLTQYTCLSAQRIIMCYRYFLLLMNMKIFLNIDLALKKNDKILIVLDHMKDTIYRHVKT